MLTSAAARSAAWPLTGTVMSRAALDRLGIGYEQVQSQLNARRWRTCGRAVILHNGALSRRDRWDAALVNTGPRAILAAFTAAEYAGLRGWERDEVHLLAAAGVRRPDVSELTICLHRTGNWPWPADPVALRCQAAAPAVVLAASTFTTARPACGILAAAVQQQVTRSAELRRVLVDSARVRHRALLLAALRDIAGGSDALSEIDFVRLCRRNGLPSPIQQLRRRDSAGRNRYLDATWRRWDGRLVVAEVDGALHLSPRRWWDDQHRQNELMISGALVLRFPSVIIRTEERSVVQQLRGALRL